MMTRRKIIQSAMAGACVMSGLRLRGDESAARSSSQIHRPVDDRPDSPDAVEYPVIKGKFKHVLDPPGQTLAKAPRGSWYINDHCFIVDKSGKIHWFGINNPFGGGYGPGSHRRIGHAVASDPLGPWTACEPAMELAPDDQKGNIGACWVFEKDGTYLMCFGYNSGFGIAKSADLNKWEIVRPMGSIKLGGNGTRDPCIITRDDGTLLLYAAGASGNISNVLLGTSKDGVEWTTAEPAMKAGDLKSGAGALESPFVVKRGRLYYLFVNHSHHQYEETLVFVSDNPLKFDWSRPLCTLFSHAAEILEWNGKTYISHCGIEDAHWRTGDESTGLYLAELRWSASK